MTTAAELYRNSRSYGLQEAALSRAAGHRGEGSARYWQGYLRSVRRNYLRQLRAHLERCLGLPETGTAEDRP